MRTSPLLSLVLTFILSLASAVHDQEVEIFAWPLASDKPQPLATVVYTATNASIKSYTPPVLPSTSSNNDDEIVRIGFYHPSGHYSAIATAASNLASTKSKKLLQLHVQPDGTLYHLGFKTGAEPVSQGKGKDTVRDLNVEVVMLQAGPKVALNRPVVVSADGEVEEKEVEKTFLQKYWWAIGLFLLVQVVMGGSKE